MSLPVKRILFPTDFSDPAQNAFVHALLLAQALGSSLKLLHVIYPEYEAMDLPMVAPQATRAKVEAAQAALEGFRDLGMKKMREYVGPEEVPDIQVEKEIGTAKSVITHTAEREKIDLIVMGTRGSHDALDRAFGNVSAGVIERSPCPVWLVPESVEYRKPRRVLYATGFEERNPEPLREVTGILAPFQPELHIAHIRKAGLDVEPADFTGWEDYISGREKLSSLEFHDVLGDSITEELDELVERLEADLLVMFSPHHNFLERLFRVSQTQRMAHKTHIPLLVVKSGKE